MDYFTTLEEVHEKVYNNGSPVNYSSAVYGDSYL